MPRKTGNFAACLPIAVLIFVCGCLVSSARLVVEAPRGHIPDNVARRSDLRFAELKAALPAEGVVGYIGSSADSIGYYYLAQYALAPLVLDHSVNHPLIVGNFPFSAPQLPVNVGVLRDFGNGVLLLATKDEP